VLHALIPLPIPLLALLQASYVTVVQTQNILKLMVLVVLLLVGMDIVKLVASVPHVPLPTVRIVVLVLALAVHARMDGTPKPTHVLNVLIPILVLLTALHALIPLPIIFRVLLQALHVILAQMATNGILSPRHADY